MGNQNSFFSSSFCPHCSARRFRIQTVVEAPMPNAIPRRTSSERVSVEFLIGEADAVHEELIGGVDRDAVR